MPGGAWTESPKRMSLDLVLRTEMLARAVFYGQPHVCVGVCLLKLTGACWPEVVTRKAFDAETCQ